MSPLDTTKCFAVKRGEITGRADVNFWRLTPLFRERFAKPHFPAVALGSLVELVQYGCSSLARPEPVGVPMLRMNNLQDNGWDLSDLKYIEMDADDLERYRLLLRIPAKTRMRSGPWRASERAGRSEATLGFSFL